MCSLVAYLLRAAVLAAGSMILSACAPGARIAAGSTGQALRCDRSIDAVFAADAETKVVLVKAFRKGEVLVLDTPTTPSAPAAPVAADDLCLVKLMVGPGNPGPLGAPSTSAGIGIEV